MYLTCFLSTETHVDQQRKSQECHQTVSPKSQPNKQIRSINMFDVLAGESQCCTQCGKKSFQRSDPKEHVQCIQNLNADYIFDNEMDSFIEPEASEPQPFGLMKLYRNEDKA